MVKKAIKYNEQGFKKTHNLIESTASRKSHASFGDSSNEKD